MNSKDKIFVYRNASYFPLPIVIFGIALIGAGLFSLQETYWALLLLPFGAILSFSSSGIEIKQGMYRTYTSILFFRTGKWEKNIFKYLTYSRADVRARMYGGSSASFLASDVQYTFYLLTADQTEKNSRKLVVILGKGRSIMLYEKIALHLQVEKLKQIH